ncbi:hypothetical protein BLNAU_23060 [Blattamonas nauphoetae]|uniref:Uncharacterized protein n=1 Tax=Blattamonas nauphoetae TaxID=2049346 RepID=A0ABQ9WR93_9EUKA|nr:hypothetical protein BLNAU_23060 [Blattamonas nauphoetae]
MEMFEHLIFYSLPQVQISLVKADLIPQLVTTLNPQSLSFTEAADIRTYLVYFITRTVSLASQFSLAKLRIEDNDEQQTVRETVLKQVLIPSEKYICPLCTNRFSIIDEDLGRGFLTLLAKLLEISHSYHPTMEFILNMPVFLTIPSRLTFIEYDHSIYYFLLHMIDNQWEWNIKRGPKRPMWKKAQRMLRMEGFEDTIEEKLQNNKNEFDGSNIVSYSIQWNNLQGMNLPKQE